MNKTLFELSRQCGQLLLSRGWRVTTAESCTGGWIAQSITAVPGSSDWFDSGFVTYSNGAKCRLLKVPASCFDGSDAPGAVSEQTVKAMALGALQASGAQVAIATSGIAGPTGGSSAKPVGTVWTCLAWQLGAGQEPVTQAWVQRFSGNREAVRRQSVQAALQALLQMLIAQPSSALAAPPGNTG